MGVLKIFFLTFSLFRGGFHIFFLRSVEGSRSFRPVQDRDKKPPTAGNK